MKSKSIPLAGILFSLFIFTSCNNGTAISSNGGETAQESKDSILRWNINTEPETLDPMAYDAPVLLTELIFCGLVEFNPESNEISPALLSSWETDASQKKWTFHLNTDIYWIGKNENGELEQKRPVTAEDVVYAIARLDPGAVWAEEIGGKLLARATNEAGMQYRLDRLSQKKQIEAINILNDSTFSVQIFDDENALDWFTHESWFEQTVPIPVEFINNFPNVGEKWNTDIWYRSDALYYLEKWIPGDSIVLIKNPFNTEMNENLPSAIQFTWEDPDQALQKLYKGEMDIVELPIDRGSFVFDDWRKGEFLNASNKIYLSNRDIKEKVEYLRGPLSGEWETDLSLEVLSDSQEAAFTYQNPAAVEIFNQGNYDPDSKEEIYDPTFPALADALETGKTVIIKNLAIKTEEDWADSDVWLCFGINRMENIDGSYNLAVINKSGYDVNVKVDEAGTLSIPGVGKVSDTWHIEVYEPNEPVCYYGTVYIAMNLDVPPYDNVDVRKSLAAITDRETYMLETQGNTEGLSYTLIPQQLLGEYSKLGDNYTTTFTQSAEVDLSSLGGIELSYCGTCEDSDYRASGITSVWGKNLGSEVKAKPITGEEYQQPIKGQEIGMTFSAGYTNSWFDFAYQWVKDGWIMVPEDQYEDYFQFVEAAALERDKEKQALMIMEINRILTEDYVSIIPLYWSEICE